MAITAMNSREITETPANATACPDIVIGAAAADAGDPLDRPTLPAGKDVSEDIVATWHLAKPAADRHREKSRRRLRSQILPTSRQIRSSSRGGRSFPRD